MYNGRWKGSYLSLVLWYVNWEQIPALRTTIASTVVMTTTIQSQTFNLIYNLDSLTLFC